MLDRGCARRRRGVQAGARKRPAQPNKKTATTVGASRRRLANAARAADDTSLSGAPRREPKPTRKSTRRVISQIYPSLDTCRGLGNGAFRGQLIFGGARFQLLELQRQLIDEPLRSLRAGTVELALQLGDPQLLMRNQGQVFRRLGPCHRQFCCAGIAFRHDLSHLRAFDCQRRLQRINILRQVFTGSGHAGIES